MVSAISAINNVYLPYQVARIAQMTNVQRTRIVEKPFEVDQLNRINEFLSNQNSLSSVQVSNVNTTGTEAQRANQLLFGSSNVLSVYNQPVPAFNRDFFIAYYGIKTNKS